MTASSKQNTFEKHLNQVWRSPLPILFICAIGLALRIHLLGMKSLWLDEGVSAMIIRLPWSEFKELLLTREGNMAPYYLLLRAWGAFGSSEVYLRSFSVIAGTLTIPAIYILGLELYSRSVGIVAALFLALHPFHIRYSQEARGYALMGLVLVLA